MLARVGGKEAEFQNRAHLDIVKDLVHGYVRAYNVDRYALRQRELVEPAVSVRGSSVAQPNSKRADLNLHKRQQRESFGPATHPPQVPLHR